MAEPPLVSILRKGIHKDGIFGRNDLRDIGIDLDRKKVPGPAVEAVNIVLEEMLRGIFRESATTCYRLASDAQEDLQQLVTKGLHPELGRAGAAYDRTKCVAPVTDETERDLMHWGETLLQTYRDALATYRTAIAAWGTVAFNPQEVALAERAEEAETILADVRAELETVQQEMEAQKALAVQTGILQAMVNHYTEFQGRIQTALREHHDLPSAKHLLRAAAWQREIAAATQIKDLPIWIKTAPNVKPIPEKGVDPRLDLHTYFLKGYDVERVEQLLKTAVAQRYILSARYRMQDWKQTEKEPTVAIYYNPPDNIFNKDLVARFERGPKTLQYVSPAIDYQWVIEKGPVGLIKLTLQITQHTADAAGLVQDLSRRSIGIGQELVHHLEALEQAERMDSQEWAAMENNLRKLQAEEREIVEQQSDHTFVGLVVMFMGGMTLGLAGLTAGLATHENRKLSLGLGLGLGIPGALMYFVGFPVALSTAPEFTHGQELNSLERINYWHEFSQRHREDK